MPNLPALARCEVTVTLNNLVPVVLALVVLCGLIAMVTSLDGITAGDRSAKWNYGMGAVLAILGTVLFCMAVR
jgi:hypothetical protein